MIRPARPDDAPFVAPLMVQAMKSFACVITCSDDPINGLPVFEHFFRLPHNQYSYENTYVFEDEKGIAGSISSYDGALLDEYRIPFFEYLAANYGFWDFGSDRETIPEEYYIDTLSVYPAMQGKGIGRKLISAALKRARQLSDKPPGLIVSVANEKAKGLYLSLGFEIVGKRMFAGVLHEHLQVIHD